MKTTAKLFCLAAMMVAMVFVSNVNAAAENGGKENQTTAKTISGLMDVSVYPNPSKDLIHLHFSLGEIKDISVDLIDINGRRAIETITMESPVGPNDLEIPCSALPVGNYILRITSEDGVYDHKVIISHN